MRSTLNGRLLAALVFIAVGAPTGVAAEEANPGASTLTRERIEAFAGSEPERCVDSAPDLELCTWRLEGQLLNSDLQNALPGVNLVCEVPRVDASRRAGSCVAHARGIANPDGGLPHVSSAPPAMADAARVSTHWLIQARTVTELSHLVGDAPDACRPGLVNQTCSWTIESHAVNFDLFAALAPGERVVELRCVLPVEGGGRVANSCDVRPIGSDR